MSLLPYDVNTYVKSKLLTDNANVNSSLKGFWPTSDYLQFVPLNEAEPCTPDGQPLGVVYVRYFWMPNVMSMRTYFIRKDRIRYYVMGRDYDQMWKVSERIVEILDPVHQNPVLATPKPLPASTGKPENFIFSSWIIGSNSMAPTEIGGLAATMLEFEVRYRQDKDLNGEVTGTSL